MTRNLKVVGLALAAVLALSAFMAASASANYTSNSKTTVLHGNQVTTHVFTTAVGKVTCVKATFKAHSESTGATAPYTVKELTVVPTYTECTAFGFKATVNMNGCDYKFLEAKEQKASTEVLCPAEKSIEIVAAGFCTMKVGAQKPTGQVVFTNEGSGSTADVSANSSLSGISYSGNCGSGSTATYTGTTTMKGYTSEALTTQTGISVM